MRAVVQRVNNSQVLVNNEIVGSINNGLLVLLGIGEDDNTEDVNYLSEKIVNLRIFEDDEDKLNLSLLDIKGELLVVSQFTLFGDCRKGRRPNFMSAAKPSIAKPLYKKFVQKCEDYDLKVQTGKFGGHMEVKLVNDGPVTMLLDSKKTF